MCALFLSDDEEKEKKKRRTAIVIKLPFSHQLDDNYQQIAPSLLIAVPIISASATLPFSFGGHFNVASNCQQNFIKTLNYYLLKKMDGRGKRSLQMAPTFFLWGTSAAINSDVIILCRLHGSDLLCCYYFYSGPDQDQKHYNNAITIIITQDIICCCEPSISPISYQPHTDKWVLMTHVPITTRHNHHHQ